MARPKNGTLCLEKYNLTIMTQLSLQMENDASISGAPEKKSPSTKTNP